MQPEQADETADLELLKAIVMQAPDAVIFADRDGTIRVWNRGAATIFGYTAAEALGNNVDLIIPDRFRRAHGEGFRRAMDTGRVKHVDRVMTTRSMRKDGSKLYVDLSFGLMRDRAGTVIGALATARDCTARHESDAALRARVLELERSLEIASRPVQDV